MWDETRNAIITILGTGLSAAYAAWAVHAIAPMARVEILGPKPVATAGAIWARTNPTPYEMPLHNIGVTLRGKADVYAQKQWGTLDPTTAHRRSSQMEVERGYDPALLMRKTFLKFQPAISQFRQQSEVLTLAANRTAVIQTFSLDFKAQQQLVRIPVVTHPSDSTEFMYCSYNGLAGDPVVRESLLFGRMFYELPFNATAEQVNSIAAGAEGRMVVYPLDIPPWCEQQPLTWEQRHLAPNVLLVGRYPQFDRTHLAHQAFDDVQKFLREIFYGE